MEPKLVNDSKLSNVLNELLKLEPVFHHPELGTTRKDFENMMDDSFWEVGSSGNRYSREFVLDVLEKRAGSEFTDVWKTSDFYCMEIAPNNYLLTYTLLQRDRLTRRMSIWRYRDDVWKIVYHQGTVVEKS